MRELISLLAPHESCLASRDINIHINSIYASNVGRILSRRLGQVANYRITPFDSTSLSNNSFKQGDSLSVCITTGRESISSRLAPHRERRGAGSSFGKESKSIPWDSDYREQSKPYGRFTRK